MADANSEVVAIVERWWGLPMDDGSKEAERSVFGWSSGTEERSVENRINMWSILLVSF